MAGSSGGGGGASLAGGEPAEPSPRVADPFEIQRQLERQRQQWGASRRVGGALPAFLALDMAILVTLVLLWVLMYAWPHACGGLVLPFRLADSSDPASGSALPTSLVWVGFEGCTPLDTSSPVFWSSLYNLKLAYGLLSFPFLIFELPVIGETLVKVRRTAYDQTGLLVPQLGKAEVATLYDRAHPGAVHLRSAHRHAAGAQGGAPTADLNA
jgi:hypothetical protein